MSASAKQANRMPFHPMSGILGIIQPPVKGRLTAAGVAQQMANARLALALRDDPPQALQLALLQAYRRHRPTSH